MANSPSPAPWVGAFLKVFPLCAILLIIVLLKPWDSEIREYEQTVITSVLSFFAGVASTVYAFHYGNGRDES